MPKVTDTHTKTPAPRKKGAGLWIAATAVLLAVCLVLIGFSSGDGGRVYPVYINEILASNTAYPNGDGRCCDYIELYNSADYPLDLTGFQLGDVAGSTRYVFPYGTVIDAHSYLVIYCDSTVEESSYAKFGISRTGGENLYLIAGNGAIVDRMTTLPTDLDQAMVRVSEDAWSLTASVTPGKPNDSPSLGQDVYNPGVSPVRINEFSAAGNGYVSGHMLFCDWVELHNTSASSADISGFVLSDNAGNDK